LDQVALGFKQYTPEMWGEWWPEEAVAEMGKLEK